MMRSRFLISGLFVLALSACGTDSNRGIPKASVKGTVTFKGQPVREGMVTFSSPETGIGTSVTINPPGEFKIADGIELGTYQVSIAPPAAEEVAGAPAPQQKKEYPDIPQKFRAPHSSGLTATVEKGENQFHFELGDK